jgi:uncharacterized protein (TIGR03118 family)
MHRLGRFLITASATAVLAAGMRANAQFPVLRQTNLVTDDQSVNGALITDPNAVNMWGVSFSGGSPFWVSDNGAGVATLYSVNPSTNATSKLGLTVSIPGDGSVTGQAFNSAGAAAFHADNFLFVSEDGTVSGWRGALGTTAETLQTGSTANVYKGAAYATIGSHSYLYAANFRAGTIDVIKGDAGAPALTGTFTDPTLPSGFAPFNVQRLGSTMYVTYALQDAAKHDDVAGLGNGFVDAYDLNGNFVRRIGSAGTLDSPWGVTLAPSSFGSYGGDLLVGNFGDGHINAFDPLTGTFIGLLGAEGSSDPLSIDGLWDITPGNGGGAGNPNQLYFSAGPAGESHGLFGTLQAVPEPGPALWGLAALVPVGIMLRRRIRTTK